MLLPFCCPQKSKCISFRHWHQLSKGQKIPFISFWAVKVVNCKCCAIAYTVVFPAMKKEIKITRNQILEYDLVLKTLVSQILVFQDSCNHFSP